MRRFWVCVLVVLISLGVVAVMGGCGGGGGGGGLPKSTATYEGPNNPAVIDSTTAAYFLLGPWELANPLELTSLDAPAETTSTYQGSISGTATVWGRYEVKDDTATRFRDKLEYKLTYDNYRDEFGTTFDGVLAGEGSYYGLWTTDITYTGAEGPWVTWNELYHDNYSDFLESGEGYKERTSGWITWDYDWFNDTGLWNVDVEANGAHRDFVADVYDAILNVEGTLKWDGSKSTWAAHGKMCREGEAPDGCFDFDFNIFWDYAIATVEEYPTVPQDYPAGGTAEYTTADALAMFAFGSSPGNPSCYLVSVDEGRDGTFELDEEEFCGWPWD